MLENETELYKRRFERERLARKQAEQIAEDKSREIYVKTQELDKAIAVSRAAEQDTALLLRAAKSFASILSIYELIESFRGFLNEIVPSDYITIYTRVGDLFEKTTEDKGTAADKGEGINSPGKLQFLTTLRFPVIIDDAGMDKIWSGLGIHQDTVSILILSMTTRNQVIGYVFLENKKRNVYDQKTSQLMQTLADEAVITLENARLFQEMETLSITDPLTGLHNRRHFEAAAKMELLLSIRHHLPLSVLILDIDHFKSINDTYGHSAGDKVLVEIADICRHILRATDINVRLGGEEFAFLCPSTGIQGGFVLAERIRTAISNHIMDVGSAYLKITASIGIAELNKDDTIVSLLRRADEALYQAKDNGRNQTVIWENRHHDA
jgi:diguanylate cyclase (GGDEF)-like protein